MQLCNFHNFRMTQLMYCTLPHPVEDKVELHVLSNALMHG